MEVSHAGTSSGPQLRVDTPAKLNLFLEILGKRSDGFHEIETLMVAISIYDTLYVAENSQGSISLSCEWATGLAARNLAACNLAARNSPTRRRGTDEGCGELPLELDNLVYRAAERLRLQSGTRRGATIHLVKRIPAAAGLGGASSDAAAVLRALDRLWRLDWPRERLAELAAELGSDVPFFLPRARMPVHAAICRGRGERIEWEWGVPPLHFVVVKPPVGLSTGSVYRRCRVPRSAHPITELQRALQTGNPTPIGRALHNRLQEPAEELCSWITALRQRFARAGVLGHQMSGSGTSYFGVCRTAREARHLAARLRSSRINGCQASDTVAGAEQFVDRARPGSGTGPSDLHDRGIGEVYYATTRPAW